MKKLLYIEEEFLNPTLCKPFIDLHIEENDTFLEAVTHSNSNESLSYSPDIPEVDGDYGAIYLGGDVKPVDIKLSKDELFASVIGNVTKICKSFHNNIQLDYCGVIRWPTGTFMKPHIDPHRPDQEPDLFAAVLYLNDDYIGGHTGFEESEIKPETGKLLVFSNSIYKHHVTKIEGSERFALNIWYNRK